MSRPHPPIASVLRAAAGPWVVLLTPVFLLLMPPLLHGEIWFHEDLEYYFYGLRRQLRQFWLEGHLHGWNPAVSCGIPLLADIQLAAFYPLNLVFYWLEPGPAFNVYFLLHFLLGTWFCRAFLRSLGLSPWPAALGTLIFLWSGFFWAHLHHVTFLAAGIWLPAMLHAWDWLIQPHGSPWRRWPALAAALGMAALAGGSPQILYYELLTLGTYALTTLRLERPPSSRLASALAAGALAGLVGIGMAGVQLWPFYLASLEKFRQVLPPLEYSSSFALSLLAVGRFLVPNLFGNDFYAFQGRGYVGPGTYWENWCYLGVVTVPLLALGMGRSGRRGFFSWLFGLSLLGCFGTMGGLHAVLATALPLYARFRAPSRLFMLTGLAAGVLAAMALEALMRRREGQAPPTRELDRLPRVVKFTVVLGLELWLLCGLSIFLREDRLHPVVSWGWGLAAVLLLASGAWLRAVGRGQLGRRELEPGVIGAVTTVLLLVDLVPVLWTYNHSVPAEEAVRVPSVVQAIHRLGTRDRILSDRSAPSYLLNSGTELGYRNVRGYNPLNPGRIVEFLEAADGAGPREGGISALVNRPTSYMLTLLAPRLQVTRDLRPAGRFVERYHDPVRELRVYEDLEAMPRAWLTGTLRVLPDPEAVLGATHAAAHQRPPPLLVEGNPSGLEGLEPAAVAGSSIEWEVDRPDDVVLKVTTAGRVALVLADTFATGWDATVDALPVPIFPAYHALRAVAIPGAGVHRVAFRYHTPGLPEGTVLSAISLAVLLMGVSRVRR